MPFRDAVALLWCRSKAVGEKFRDVVSNTSEGREALLGTCKNLLGKESVKIEQVKSLETLLQKR